MQRDIDDDKRPGSLRGFLARLFGKKVQGKSDHAVEGYIAPHTSHVQPPEGDENS